MVKREDILLTKEVKKETGFDPKILGKIEIIAQVVGGDFGLRVQLNKLGRGSNYDSEKALIGIDPTQFIKKDDPRLRKLNEELKDYLSKVPSQNRAQEIEKAYTEVFAKYFPEIREEDMDWERLAFLLGHEGGHRAISRGPNEIGLREEKIKEFYSKIGFSYGQNMIEDPSVNNWVRDKFPKIGESMKIAYDEQVQHENVPAGVEHHDVQKAIAILGHIPRFAWFGSEIIKYWWAGKFSENLKPEIKKALEKVKNVLPGIFTTIPVAEKTEEETIEKARERFSEYLKKVWPVLERLVKLDIDDAKLKEMEKEMRDKVIEKLKGKGELLDEFKKRGEKQKDKVVYEEGPEWEMPEPKIIEGAEPIEIKQEFSFKAGMKVRYKETGQEGVVTKIYPNGDIEVEFSSDIDPRFENPIDKFTVIEVIEPPPPGTPPPPPQPPIKIEKVGKWPDKEIHIKGKPKSKESLPSDIQEAMEPEDYSPALKKELEKIFNKLPEETKKQLEKEAKEGLENIEDQLNKLLEEKLSKDKLESHQERKVKEGEEEKKKAELKDLKERIRDAVEKAKKEYRDRLEKEKTEYENVYDEMYPLIESLYRKLKQIFEPIEGEWKTGFPYGQKLDVRKAKELERKPELITKIWERRKAPQKYDYRFLLLVDMSGSMGKECDYVKIKETFKGVVVLTEVLNKLNIPAEVIGFSGNLGFKKYKDFETKLDKSKRDDLSLILGQTGGGTPTDEATVYAWEEFKKKLSEHNFLITLTDGRPDSSSATQEAIKQIVKEKKIKLVGIGLGPGTEFVKEFYPASLHLDKIKPIEREKVGGKKSFDKVMAKLLEVMIRFPERTDYEDLINK